MVEMGSLVDVAVSLGIVALGFVGAMVVHHGMRMLGEMANRSRFRFDGVVVKVLSRPLAILVALTGIVVGLRQLDGAAAWLDRWPGVEPMLLVVAGTWVLAGLVREVVDVYGRPFVESSESDFDDRLLGIVDLAATLVIWIVGLLLALSVLGIQITPFLASLGVVGLAVALAVRTILSNFFGGLVLTADRTIQPGHRVRVTDWIGDVVEIGRYKTTIRTRDNLLVSLPNDVLMSETVVNYNLPNALRRVEMHVGVAYGADLERASAILLETVAEVPGVVMDPEPEVNVVELADSAVVLEVLAWQDRPTGARRTRDHVFRQALRRFHEAGIEVPFPQRDVWMRSSNGSAAPADPVASAGSTPANVTSEDGEAQEQAHHDDG